MSRVWITRVRPVSGDATSGTAGEVSLRCVTSGSSPEPDDGVEQIEDPFVAAVRSEASAAELARTSAPMEGGLRGTWAELGNGLVLAPPVRPSKVLGIGRNYRAHAEELGNTVPDAPLLFFKPPSCLLASGAALRLPTGYERIDMEAELVVVIGRRARAVTRAEAWSFVAGLTLGNDISCRDLQRRDKQWTRAKGFDGFGPLGPWIRMQEDGEAMPTGDLRIRGFLDDAPVQEGRIADMVFTVEHLVEHITACMTLEPGDLIYTGTPAGVSPLSPGQVSRIELAGLDLGRLTTPVS